MAEEKSEWDKVKEAFSQQELLAFNMGDVWKNMLKSLTGFKEALDNVGNTTEKMAEQASRDEEGKIAELKDELKKGLKTLKEVSQTTPDLFEKTSLFLVADYIIWTKAFLPFFLVASIVPAILGLIFSEFTNVNLPIISLLPPWVGSFIAMMLISVWLWRSITLLAKRLYSLVITFLPGIAQYFYNLLFIPEDVKLTGLAFLGAGALSISVIALGISFGLGIMELLFLFAIVGLFTFLLIKFTSVLSKFIGSSLIFIIITRALSAALESSLGVNIMSMTALQSIFFIGTLLGFVMWFDMLVHLTLIISLNVSSFILRKTMTTGISSVFGLDLDAMKDVFGSDIDDLAEEIDNFTKDILKKDEKLLEKYRKAGKGAAVTIKNVETGKKAIIPAASKLTAGVKEGVSKTQLVTMKQKKKTENYTVASLDENTHLITHKDSAGVTTTHTVSGPLQNIGATIAKTFGLKGKFTTTTTNVMEAGLGEDGKIQAVSKFNRENITNVRKDSNGKLFFEVMGKTLSFDPTTEIIGSGSTTASLSAVKGKTRKSAVDDILGKLNDEQVRKVAFGASMDAGTGTTDIFKTVGLDHVLDQDKVAESFENIIAPAMRSYNEHASAGHAVVSMMDDGTKIGDQTRFITDEGAAVIKKVSKSEFEFNHGGKTGKLKLSGSANADQINKVLSTMSHGELAIGSGNKKINFHKQSVSQINRAIKMAASSGQQIRGLPANLKMKVVTSPRRNLFGQSKKSIEFHTSSDSKITVEGGQFNKVSKILGKTKIHGEKGHRLTPELTKMVGGLDQILKRQRGEYSLKLENDRALYITKTSTGYEANIPRVDDQALVEFKPQKTLTDLMLSVGKSGFKIERSLARVKNPEHASLTKENFDKLYSKTTELGRVNYQVGGQNIAARTTKIQSIDPANLTNTLLGELGTSEANLKTIMTDEKADTELKRIKKALEDNKDGEIKTIALGNSHIVSVRDKTGNEVLKTLFNQDMFATEFKEGADAKSLAYYKYQVDAQDRKKISDGRSIDEAVSQIISKDTGLAEPGAQADRITDIISEVSEVRVDPPTGRIVETIRSDFLGRNEGLETKLRKVEEKLDQSDVLTFRTPDKSREYTIEKVDGLGQNNYVVSTKDSRGRRIDFRQMTKPDVYQLLSSGVNFWKWEYGISTRQISLHGKTQRGRIAFKVGEENYTFNPTDSSVEVATRAQLQNITPPTNDDRRNLDNIRDSFDSIEGDILEQKLARFVTSSIYEPNNFQTFELYNQRVGKKRCKLAAQSGQLYIHDKKQEEETGNPWKPLNDAEGLKQAVGIDLGPNWKPPGSPPSPTHRTSPGAAAPVPPSGILPGPPATRIPGPPITPVRGRREEFPTLVTPPGGRPLGDRDLTSEKEEPTTTFDDERIDATKKTGPYTEKPETPKSELDAALEKRRKRIEDQEKQGINDVIIKKAGGKKKVGRKTETKRFKKVENFPEEPEGPRRKTKKAKFKDVETPSAESKRPSLEEDIKNATDKLEPVGPPGKGPKMFEKERDTRKITDSPDLTTSEKLEIQKKLSEGRELSDMEANVVGKRVPTPELAETPTKEKTPMGRKLGGIGKELKEAFKERESDEAKEARKRLTAYQGKPLVGGKQAPITTISSEKAKFPDVENIELPEHEKKTLREKNREFEAELKAGKALLTPPPTKLLPETTMSPEERAKLLPMIIEKKAGPKKPIILPRILKEEKEKADAALKNIGVSPESVDETALVPVEKTTKAPVPVEKEAQTLQTEPKLLTEGKRKEPLLLPEETQTTRMKKAMRRAQIESIPKESREPQKLLGPGKPPVVPLPDAGDPPLEDESEDAPSPTIVDERPVTSTATMRSPSPTSDSPMKVIATSKNNMRKVLKASAEKARDSAEAVHVQLSFPGQRDVVTMRRTEEGIEIELPNLDIKETLPSAAQAANRILKIKEDSVDFIKNRFSDIPDFVKDTISGDPGQSFHMDDTQGPVFSAEVLDNGKIKYQRRGLPEVEMEPENFARLFNMHASQTAKIISSRKDSFKSGAHTVLPGKEGHTIIGRTGEDQKDFRLFHKAKDAEGHDINYYGVKSLKDGRWAPTIAQRIDEDGNSQVFEVKTVFKDGKRDYTLVPLERPLAEREEKAIRMSAGSVTSLMTATSGKVKDKIKEAEQIKSVERPPAETLDKKAVAYGEWTDKLVEWRNNQINMGANPEVIKRQMRQSVNIVWRDLTQHVGDDKAKKLIDKLFEGL